MNYEHHIQAYQQFGHTIITDVVTADLDKAIADLTVEQLTDGGSRIVREDSALWKIADLGRNLPNIGAMTDAAVRPVVEAFAGGVVEVIYDEFVCKKIRGGGNYRTHQDGEFFGDKVSLTAWLFFDEAGADTGGVVLYPQSHHQGMFSRDAIDGHLAVVGTSEESPPIPAGSLLLLHPHLVHRGAPNLTKLERRSIATSYRIALT